MDHDPLSTTFAALADPTRRAILERLAGGDATVGEVAERFAMTLPAISKHLSVLERAGLVAKDRDGQRRNCRITATPLKSATQGLEEYRSVRTYTDMKGYALAPKFVFIDGRTGAQLYSETYHEEALYPSTQNTPALSSYFELMDKVLPSFLNTLSSQKIR